MFGIAAPAAMRKPVPGFGIRVNEKVYAEKCRRAEVVIA